MSAHGTPPSAITWLAKVTAAIPVVDAASHPPSYSRISGSGELPAPSVNQRSGVELPITPKMSPTPHRFVPDCAARTNPPPSRLRACTVYIPPSGTVSVPDQSPPSIDRLVRVVQSTTGVAPCITRACTSAGSPPLYVPDSDITASPAIRW